MNYAKRFYRDYSRAGRWEVYNVRVDTTDLFVRSTIELKQRALEAVITLRKKIEDHITMQDEFLHSFKPVHRLPGTSDIITAMYGASEKTGVGPMASVAGAIAMETGKILAQESEEMVIENGGDIWMKLAMPAEVTVFSGSNHISSLALKIYPENTPCGICTSSGRLGHSFSYGRADSVTIVSKQAALADAVATETCNRVKEADDLEKALDFALGINGVEGALILFRDKLAAQGNIELTQ